jgi:hypothetical protein
MICIDFYVSNPILFLTAGPISRKLDRDFFTIFTPEVFRE